MFEIQPLKSRVKRLAFSSDAPWLHADEDKEVTLIEVDMIDDRSFAPIDGDDMPPDGIERRHCPRYKCEGLAEVEVSHPYTLIRGELRDIGLEGCFVATRAYARPSLKSAARLRFQLGEHEYSTNAQVANIRPGEGIGLEFQFTSELTRKVARAMIERLQHRFPEPELGHHLFHYGNTSSHA